MVTARMCVPRPFAALASPLRASQLPLSTKSPGITILSRGLSRTQLPSKPLRPAASIPSPARRHLHQWVPRRPTPPSREPEDDHSKRPRRKQRPAVPLRLYAGIGLFSLLLALARPLSFIDAQEQERQSPDRSPSPTTSSSSAPSSPPSTVDSRDPDLPRFRLADIRKHDATSGAPWVTSGDRVYDITDWVLAHPGGEIILRAAGRSIDPYWAIFTIHKADHVRQILDSYLIGLVDAADLGADGRPVAAAGDRVEDPFASDPVRDPLLRVHTAKPCNAETPAAQLTDAYTTPNELFYVRNHMWVPEEDGANADDDDAQKLTIERPDGEERTYTLAELRTRFPRHRITAVLQCSGNRRSDMTRAVGPTNGLQWAVGAIGNAVWEGVLLRDVLADAGVGVDDAAVDAGNSAPLHVHMAGREAYAASIPLAVALDPRADVLLAFRMNGAPLPRDHGFPLRAIVPGHVAARSVKWLARIVVADEEAPSQWQRRDYKLFGPNEGSHPQWDRYPAIQELPVTSAITSVSVGGGGGGSKTPTTAADGRAPPGVHDLQAWQRAHTAAQAAQTYPLTVAGYAYAGGGREIVRVDVSVDGGRTWDQAELLDQQSPSAAAGQGIVADGHKHWAWKRWRYQTAVSLGPDALATDGNGGSSDGGGGDGGGDGGGGDTGKAACADIFVKAVDSAYNSQPERHAGIYNVRGNLATAWHRVRVCRVCRPPQTPDPAGSKGTVWHVSGCGFDQPATPLAKALRQDTPHR